MARAVSEEAGCPTSQAQPVTLAGCLGWLHMPPTGRARGRGVVICAGWGHEGVIAYRGLHELGRRLAAAGIPALRIDYPGAGDSAGDDMPATLPAIRAAVAEAAAWLRRHAGVGEVALCGFRLGALLAAQVAACTETRIDALALLAPVASGRGWLREMLLRAQAGSGEVGPDRCWLEATGERLHRDDMAELDRAELVATLAGAGVPRTLLLERRPALAARLPAPCVTALRFEGLDDFLTLPHASRVPVADLDRVAAWLADGAPEGGAAQPWPAPMLELEGAVERPLRFGPGGQLAGVLCQPSGDTRRVGVLLLSTGTTPRAGVGRLGTRLARRLARIGVASLRMDLAGIGDSDPVPGQADMAAPPDLYRDTVAAEAQAGLDLLAGHGVTTCLVVGICAGAHAALQLALCDARAGGVALFNLPAFDRSAGGAPALDGGPPPAEHPWLRRPRMLVRRLCAEADSAIAGLLGLESGLNRPGRWMRGFGARGVRVLLGYSARDRGLRELRAHFGRGGRRLGGQAGVRRVMLGGTDHALAPRAMQEEAIRLVAEEVLALDLLVGARRRADAAERAQRLDALSQTDLSHARDAMLPVAGTAPRLSP